METRTGLGLRKWRLRMEIGAMRCKVLLVSQQGAFLMNRIEKGEEDCGIFVVPRAWAHLKLGASIET